MKVRFSYQENRMQRKGFTLIELIIVITILLILLAMTTAVVNFSLGAEKVGGGARQIQSYLLGARDRALHSGELRGVRFLQDPERPPEDGAVITSLVFVGESELHTGASNNARIQLERRAGDRRADIVAGNAATLWWELYQRRNLFPNGQRIRIPNDRTGSWYTIIGFANPSVWEAPAPPNPRIENGDDLFPLKMIISPPYRDPGTPLVGTGGTGTVKAYSGDHPNTYGLELPRTILPEEPVLFPKGIVIDLLSSDVPSTWLPTSSSAQNRVFREIMFSPRGSVVGSAASKGIIHFYVTELSAADLFEQHLTDTFGGTAPGLVPADDIPLAGGPPEPIGDRALVSVFTQTGAVSSHPIDPTDAVDLSGNSGADGIADDPYRFAETGEVIKQ